MSNTVANRAVEDLLQLELEEVQTQKEIPQTISKNGAESENIHTNGGDPSQMDGRGNGNYPHYPFSGNGRQPFDVSKISYEDIITEDDEPVDNFPSEKQQRLLVRPLYSSSHVPRPMIAAANVGIFHDPLVTPIVPDMFLSLETSLSPGDELWDKENRTYYVWKHGKPPEVAVEIVSNKKGGEGDLKFGRYVTLDVKYYVILDYHHAVQEETLIVYELVNGRYIARDDYLLPDVNLSLTLWDGEYEDMEWTWLRWCDLEGDLISTATENAEVERLNAQQARMEADQAQAETEQAQAEAEQAQAEAERERQEKEQALERAEKAEADAMRRIEQILAQARAAGVDIDINDLT